MKTLIQEFNALDGQIISRSILKEIEKRALKESDLKVYHRIRRVLKNDDKEFAITISSPLNEVAGMNAPRHKGLAKKGLDDCGRPKKGYVFTQGGILKKTVPLKKTNKPVIIKLTKADKILKSKLLSIGKKLSGYSDALITQGMNGDFLADGHEIATDEIDNDFISELFGMNVSAKEVEQIVNEMVMELINSGEELPPWRQTWANNSPMPAINFETKKAYSGSNAMLLNVIYGHLAKTPYYLTPNQVEKMKGNINEGAKTFPIIYYTFFHNIKNLSEKSAEESILLQKVRGYKVRLPKGKSVILGKDNYWKIQISESDIKKIGLGRDEYTSRGILRYYRVVNLSDTAGIKYELPENVTYTDNERIAKADAIIASMVDLPKIVYDPDSAVYKPNIDTIGIPNITDFETSQEYYATLFHELIHSTKIESRTNRDKFYEGKKKEQAYAFEELIAELGASYLCGICGFLEYTHQNAASYLKGWHKTLQKLTEQHGDFFLFATKEAQKAVDYIIKNYVENSTPLPVLSDNKEKEKVRVRARALLLIIKLKTK
jgi:antirestriction protein ArdC